MSRVTTEDTKRYSDAFILFNKSGNGVLTPEEFRKTMLALGRDLSVAEVNKIFSAHGSDSAGMDHEAFISYMKDMKEKTASPEEIKDALSVFDISANKDSTISIDELVNAMKEMGDKNDLLSSRECEILIDRADIDGDMKLNYREFVDYMMKQI